MAMQSWNCKGMTFFPDNDFLEFIPLDEHFKSNQNPDYQPKTLLYSELQPGIYELVFTNLLGGVFTRYRVGDLFEVISLRDEELNIDLPTRALMILLIWVDLLASTKNQSGRPLNSPAFRMRIGWLGKRRKTAN